MASSSRSVTSRLRSTCMPCRDLSKSLSVLPDEARPDPRSSLTTSWTTDSLPTEKGKRLGLPSPSRTLLCSTISVPMSSLQSKRSPAYLLSPSNVETITFSRRPGKPRARLFLEDDSDKPPTQDVFAKDVEDRPPLRIESVASTAAPKSHKTHAERIRTANTLIRSCADFRHGRDLPELNFSHELKRARWYAINYLMRMQENAMAQRFVAS
uniref:Uncharacterized protein n=1 Tax=Cryptomonas curvata TaxID=233186 RepID=A0A7S0QHD5_9CRYP|mmetsp:Transcript_2349/g.4892  ORF Transcript_2349/g.4892 Transcript_2349/m.4892 type:complete len:211 (+) Transcript_2349:35-667(+)